MDQRLTIVCGAFGSGKTEFAISYALDLQQKNPQRTGLVDLDIVNPYFRSRDVTETLHEKGIEVISTKPGLEYSDLPALSPRIYALLQDRSFQVVFDVGGDPTGARALGRFYQYFTEEAYNFWVVVNPYRPNTKILNQAQSLIGEIQQSSRLNATGLVSNINLGTDTTLEIWRDGLPLILELGESLGLPVVYHMVEEEFLEKNHGFFKDFPVFPIKLHMLPPWLQERE